MADTRWLLDADLRCRKSSHADWWISEDPQERESAMHLCAGCPFTVDCLLLASEVGAEAGVWGGQDFTPAQDALFAEAEL